MKQDAEKVYQLTKATLDLDMPVEVQTDDSLRVSRAYRRRRGIVGT